MQESFHVALFCPANVSDGVVNPPFLVLRVIASRPIGSGQGDRKFLVVGSAARDSEADVSHDDNATAIPQNAIAMPSHWWRRRRSERIFQWSPMAVNTGDV